MCHHYLLLYRRSDSVGHPVTSCGWWSWICDCSRCLEWLEMNCNCWTCWIFNHAQMSQYQKFKFMYQKVSGPLGRSVSAHKKIISQTWGTMFGWGWGRFVSLTLSCGARCWNGEQKMTTGRHFLCTPLRCLMICQSSPSWSRHGWS